MYIIIQIYTDIYTRFFFGNSNHLSARFLFLRLFVGAKVPCHYFHKDIGCKKGEMCQFCHVHEPSTNPSQQKRRAGLRRG